MKKIESLAIVLFLLFSFVYVSGDWGDINSDNESDSDDSTEDIENTDEDQVDDFDEEFDEDISDQEDEWDDFDEEREYISDKKHSKNFYIAIGVGLFGLLILLIFLYFLLREPKNKWEIKGHRHIHAK